MKVLGLIFSLLFSFGAIAADLEWSDLELYNEYTLIQKIEFPGATEIAAGEKFELQDVVAGGLPFIYYQFHQTNCQAPDLSSDMVLINPSPEDQSRDRSVAVSLDSGCNLNVWVEAQDYYSQSLFY